MKIEEQVLSIEQMKHLQELGIDTSDASMVWIKQDSTLLPDNIKELWWVDTYYDSLKPMVEQEDSDFVQTYTIGDLIEKLPIRIGSVNRKIYFTGKYIIVSYSSPDGSLIEYRGTTLLCLLYSLLCWVAETHRELLEIRND